MITEDSVLGERKKGKGQARLSVLICSSDRVEYWTESIRLNVK